MCNVFCSKLSRALSVRVRSSLIETEKKETGFGQGFGCVNPRTTEQLCVPLSVPLQIFLSTSAATSRVLSTSSSVCASDVKPASYCEGAR